MTADEQEEGIQLSRRTLGLIVDVIGEVCTHTDLSRLFLTFAEDPDLEPPEGNKRDKVLWFVKTQSPNRVVDLVDEVVNSRNWFGIRDRGGLSDDPEALLLALEKDGWYLEHDGLVFDAYRVAQEAAASDVSEPKEYVDQSEGVREVSSRVFIVHGQDHGLKEAVARLVDKLGYDAVILHERANKGRTIIEKFLGEAEDAAYAIAILTPDDMGGKRSLLGAAPVLSKRARQNVVLELGYFIGVLGRERVTALVTDSAIEKPSDILGVAYIPVSTIEDEAWRYALAKEMKAAGLKIDLDKV